jgi:integrase
VFKRGDVYHFQRMVDTVRHRGSTGETVRSKALIYEALYIARIKEGNADPKTKKAAILSDVAKKFLAQMDAQVEAKNLAYNTARSYHNGWNLLAATDVAKMRIDRITRGAAAALSFPGGPWNARNAQTTLGRILHWCVENDYIRAVPSIKRTKAKGRRLRFSPELQAQILPHMERDVADVFVIMLNCGMRPEEVLRMRWEHVYWDSCQYFNPFGKTDEAKRFVPISDKMRDLLKARSGNESKWVFPSRGIDESVVAEARKMFANGASARSVSMTLELSWPCAKRISEGEPVARKDEHRVTVAKQFEGAREAAGIGPEYVLYLCRHEFAKTFLESGGDLYSLMKIMGHADITTTMKYLHEDQASARDVINRRNHGLSIVKRASNQ